MKYLFIITLIIVPAIILFFPEPTSAAAANSSCMPVEVVYARGSGEGGPKDIAGLKLEENFSALGEKSRVNTYNLGTESYSGSQYPHVAINGSFASILRAIGAKVTAGEGFQYGRSVEKGTVELKSYLTSRLSKCPDSFFALVGFSQGAQVIGDTLFLLSSTEQGKIRYVALLGDPKLHLPEGVPRSLTNRLPACEGEELSSWRHTVDDCWTTRGVLRARDPYIPDDMEDKVNSWCFDYDGVCNDKKSVFDGHDYTSQRGMGVVAQEILSAGSTHLNHESAKELDLVTRTNIECTASLESLSYYQTLDSMRKLQKATETNPRINFVGLTYLDENAVSATPEEYINMVYQYSDLLAQPGYPENQLPRRGVKKNLYTFLCNDNRELDIGEDGFPIPPSRYNYLLRSQQTRTNQAITKELSAEDIASYTFDFTGEKTKFCTDDLCIDSLNDDDIVHLTNFTLNHESPIYFKTSYSATAGTPITFSVGVPSGDYDTYHWDFNDDGTDDATTSTPFTTYIYSQNYTGTIRVRAVGKSSNSIASTTMSTLTAQTTSQPPAGPESVKIQKLSSTSLQVSWVRGASQAARWVVRVDGFPLGHTEGSQTTLTIDEIDFSRPVTISISGIDTNMNEGEPTSATIEPERQTNTPKLDRKGSEVDRLITHFAIEKNRIVMKIAAPSTKAVSEPIELTSETHPQTLQPSTQTDPESTPVIKQEPEQSFLPLVIALSILSVGGAAVVFFIVKRIKP